MYNFMKIKVNGKNVLRFIKRLSDYKIKVYNLTMISNEEIFIIIDENSIEKINEIKTIYEIKIIETYGLSKRVQLLKINAFLIFLILVNLIVTIFLSTYIFEIEIVENEIEMRNYIASVLEEKNIKKYQKKLSFDKLTKIKNEILLENSDKIEWLEIIPNGTKYIVAVEERILNEPLASNEPTNIVATKNGVVKKIIAEKGQILVEKNQYVKKGDILIGGDIKINETSKSKIKAIGIVYAETWYKVTSEQLLHLKVHDFTDKKAKGLMLKFFNKEFKFYNGLNNILNEKAIIKSDILPLTLSITEEQESIKKDVILTSEEALKVALEKAREKIIKNLQDEEKIISENQLKVTLKDSKIIVDVLFTVYEEISIAERIEDENV